MNSFYFPEKIPRTGSETQPWPKAGWHRAKPRPADEAIGKTAQAALVEQATAASPSTVQTASAPHGLAIIDKIEMIERSIADGKVMESKCYVPIIKRTNTTDGQEECEHLRQRNAQIKATMQRAALDEGENLGKAASFLANLKNDEQLLLAGDRSLVVARKSRSEYNDRDPGRKALMHIIQMAMTALERGVFSFPLNAQILDILELLKLVGNSFWGRELLLIDNEIFFHYLNAYIFFISQRLSVIHPKCPALEVQFRDIIERMASVQADLEKSMVSHAQLEQFLLQVHTFACSVNIELEYAARQLRKRLSDLMIPKADFSLPQPDLNNEPFFRFEVPDEARKADDIARQEKLKGISNLINELKYTESTFCNSISILAARSFLNDRSETPLTFFEDLLAEKLVSQAEFQILSNGWDALSTSSQDLLDRMKTDDASKTDPKALLQCCLEAFSPHHLFNHLRNFQDVIANFTETDKIIKRVMRSECGAKKLQEFKRLARSDIINILIKPVQRPPRYELLMGELIKKLPEGVTRDAFIARQEYLKRWIQSIELLVDFGKK